MFRAVGCEGWGGLQAPWQCEPEGVRGVRGVRDVRLRKESSD